MTETKPESVLTPSQLTASQQMVVDFMRQQDPHTVHRALNIDYTTLGPELTVVETDVSERLFQHAGIVHGGVYVLLAESAASMAAALNVDMARFRVAGQEISASHLRPSTTGRLRAEARPIHKGKSAIVFTIDVTNDGKLVSTCRCTMAVRPLGG